MNLELVGALNELEQERGISKEILLSAIEAAIVSAYKRNFSNADNVRVELDERTGTIAVFAQKEVVDEVEDDTLQISLEEARERDPAVKVGDVVDVEVTPEDFGRIAAQTAKQVVIQRIREAERALIYDEFSNRAEEIVTGTVQRIDRRNVFVDLGRVEALLPPSEQMPGDNYYRGQRLKCYIAEVRQTPRGPQVILSRSHPGLLKRLFELEVPEIRDGVVEIRAAAREAGKRSKIAVWSRDDRVDPVGACVGPRGIRVQAVVQELRGEKIDIIQWDPDLRRFVKNALSPARVTDVFLSKDGETATVVVPEQQLSLAIGREGQNARLAAKLTGLRIDIKSEAQMAEMIFTRAQEEPEVEPVEAEGLPEMLEAEAEPVADELLAPEVEPAAEVELEPAGAVEDEAEAEEAVPFFELELEEPEPEPEEPKRAKLPARKVKRVVRQEIEEAIVDEVVAEDEELPSLFGSDDEDEEAPADVAEVESGPVFVSGPKAPVQDERLARLARLFQDPDLAAKEAAERQAKREREREEREREREAKAKRVLKDFSELAKLLEEE
ncbi:MAG: transcription termination/antitermination protein NusA [Firmicutes bacterium]|nr:transcription termination factor NusA [Limnochorda pilosa]MBO2485911.1 transcription termination/antitermination protein NusA [Bacillota bacterium]MBO2518924.1 transcription termination/antitermination protein NusA [Bacillota bacterium]NMA70878.1 transcription termination/antitermination protein NusA [Bacillota bacterium]